MPTRRFYANAAPQQTLASSITAGAATLQVASFAGWPTQFPYFAALDSGTASFEIVSVTGVVGTTANILRGQDGTVAIAHPAGATLNQVFVRQDLDEANAHTTASTAVHGIAGAVVGTTDTQTLTSKTMTAPVLNTPTLSNPVSTGDATHPALIGKATTGGGKTLSLQNSAAVEKFGVDDAGNVTASGTVAATGTITTSNAIAATNNITTSAGNIAAGAGVVSGKTLTGVLVPTTFTNEAAATAAGASVTGAHVYLTAPTNGGSAGLFVYNGTAWLPINMSTIRGQWTQTTGVGQTLTNGSFVTLTGFGADVDTTGGSFNLSTGIWTCGANGAGNYKVSAQCSATSGATRLIIAIQKNSVSVLSAYNTGTTVTNATATLPEKEITIAAGDAIQVVVNANAAAITTVNTNASTSFLRIERVS